MPLASDDLPLPLTPVMQVITPSGIRTSIFFRLFCRAPFTVIHAAGLRREVGTAILQRPVR